MPDGGALTGIAHAIQLAIAPVFLLTGIASLLGVMANRLARVIDRGRVLEEARRRCPEPALIDAIAPEPVDAFLCKPRYSAFDHTPLDLLLREREVRRLLLAGTATEMCVAQSAIDGRELGYQITILPGACAAVDGGNAEIALRYLAHVVGARIGLEAEAR